MDKMVKVLVEADDGMVITMLMFLVIGEDMGYSYYGDGDSCRGCGTQNTLSY